VRELNVRDPAIHHVGSDVDVRVVAAADELPRAI
jgi:hypothetical protein